MLEWGEHASRIAKIPDSPAWKNQPTLKPHLTIVMLALDDLASSRGDNGIPFNAIVSYSEVIGIDCMWLAPRLMKIDRQILKSNSDKLEKKRGK